MQNQILSANFPYFAHEKERKQGGCYEQEAIGKALSDIDCLTTLHQHKLDKLKDTKKAMLYKMFCS